MQIDDALVERVARIISPEAFSVTLSIDGTLLMSLDQSRTAARTKAHAALEAAGLSREGLREALEDIATVEPSADGAGYRAAFEQMSKRAVEALALGGDGEEG